MNQGQLKRILREERQLGFIGKITAIVDNLSLTEKLIFYSLGIVLAASSVLLIKEVNNALTVEVPARGGSFVEGLIGVPRFINPLLAISDADRDLTTLVYSGLLKAGASGDLVPDLASRYEISEDGLEYIFYLRPNATFHDGKSVTADDVIFTIEKAQNPNLKSPKRASWEGVKAEKIDEGTVKISLKQAYAPFLENATLGILPSHIWKGVEAEQFTFSEYNITPVGSGPYKVKSVRRNSGGIPVSYELVPFKRYSLGEPYIESITTKFYSGEQNLIEAYENKEVDSISAISPQKALALKALGAKNITVPLPRIFAVFFNQNQAEVFTQKEVRTALDLSVDRDRIIKEDLFGFGTPIYGPIPANFAGFTLKNNDLPVKERVEAAKELLVKNGWKPDATDGVLTKKDKKTTYRLEFSISTSNTPELKNAALIIKEDWEKLGAKVDLNFFETSDLNQSVIRPRKYSALLFGEIVGRDLDLFAFWHSSQRNDPGLNIALYTDIKADELLESARGESSAAERLLKYREFAEEVQRDIPAVFLYSPDFIYVSPAEVKGINISKIAIPSERFLSVNEWHIESDRVWKIFADKN